MNNDAAPDTIRSRTHSATQKANSRSSGPTRSDDAIRDFFRRGDRGQYNGGPADKGLESLPALDLPTRPQIVRTPKQQARRRALMQVEGVLLAGCLALLVTAARVKSHDANIPQRAVGSLPSRQTAEQSAAKASKPQQTAQPVAATHLSAPIESIPATATPPVPVAAAPGQPLPAPKAAEPSKPVETLAAAKPVAKVAEEVREPPKPVTVPVARAKPAREAEAVPASKAAAPKRAVAAFPDD